MVGDVCRKPVVMIGPDRSIEEAAHLMGARGVGSVVVVLEDKPVGVLTDRDITVKVVAQKRDPATTLVDEVMTKQLSVIKADAGLFEATRMFGMTGVRRLPVVSRQGELVGIISVDDLLILLGSEMGQIASGLAREIGRSIP